MLGSSSLAIEKCTPLHVLLTCLGIEATEEQLRIPNELRGHIQGSSNQAPCADEHTAQDAPGHIFRVEFENNFALELEALSTRKFRVSARVCRLGKSQEVQGAQLLRALCLHEEIFDPTSSASVKNSLAISPHDNCLRLICELGYTIKTQASWNSSNTIDFHSRESLLSQFEFFASDAYAFKQTYFHAESV